MKNSIRVFLIATMFLLCSGCSLFNRDNDYAHEISNIRDEISAIQSEINNINENQEKLMELYNFVASYGVFNDAPVDSDNTTVLPKGPWAEPLPDGLGAEVVFLDESTIFIIYTNNMGEDISLSVFNTYSTDDNWININTTVTKSYLLLENDKFIDVIADRDPIKQYAIECDVDDVLQSTRDAHDGVIWEIRRNENDSVTVYFNNTAGDIGFDYKIYYMAENGMILGYNSDSGISSNNPPQSDGKYDKTFEAPPFNYSDIQLCPHVFFNSPYNPENSW